MQKIVVCEVSPSLLYHSLPTHNHRSKTITTPPPPPPSINHFIQTSRSKITNSTYDSTNKNTPPAYKVKSVIIPPYASPILKPTNQTRPPSPLSQRSHQASPSKTQPHPSFSANSNQAASQGALRGGNVGVLPTSTLRPAIARSEKVGRDLECSCPSGRRPGRTRQDNPGLEAPYPMPL